MSLTAATSVTATFTLSSSGLYSIVNQPPVSTPAFYPNGLVSKTLPNAGTGGPTNHLMPNSDAVIAILVGATANGGLRNQPSSTGGGFGTGHFGAPGQNDYNNVPLYFGAASDPVYKPINVKRCGTAFEPLAVRNGSGIITNLTFHIPSGAQFSGQNGSDQTVQTWDQSGSGISNGKTVSFYAYGQGAFALPACPESSASSPDGHAHAGTQADPCVFNASGGQPYCSWDDPLNGTGYNG